MKEGMNEDKIILTKEEYDDLCANYNKVYEQAKADILDNISDGGTSCHWCINSQRKIGAKEAADKIYQFLMEHSFKSDLKPYVWINRELKDFFDSFEVQVKQMWHKVADGDLPKYAGPYLVVCGDESLPEYDVDFYESFWDGKRWMYNEGRIIAWIELPNYAVNELIAESR